tara:strand:+ start:403 stop:507 length:105 start_codon:yes stop_codon:yes gene_type:complete
MNVMNVDQELIMMKILCVINVGTEIMDGGGINEL